MFVVEQNHRAVRRHHRVERFERRLAVHPVEGAAHRHHTERAGALRPIERAALAQIERDAGPARRRAGSVQHRGLGIDRRHGHARAREGDRQRPRPAAEIQHCVAGRKTRELDDACDQPLGIWRAVAGIERHRAAEPVRVIALAGFGHLSGAF